MFLVLQNKAIDTIFNSMKNLIRNECVMFHILHMCWILLISACSQGLIMMQSSKASVMAMMSYRYQAELLVRDYLLADPIVPYTAVLSGIFMCKLVRLVFALSIFDCASLIHGLVL